MQNKMEEKHLFERLSSVLNTLQVIFCALLVVVKYLASGPL